MPSPLLPNYLRSHRKRLALSQDEVAFLLGIQSGAKVCRDERFSRKLSLESALAYIAIFKQPAHELFGGLYQEIEKQVMERAKALANKVGPDETSGKAVQRSKSLADIISAKCN